MVPVDVARAPGRCAYNGFAYSRCWASIVSEDDAVGGCSWYPRMRRLSGTPVAAATLAVWLGEDEEREIASIAADATAISVDSRLVMNRSRLSAVAVGRFTAGVDLERLISCCFGGT